MESEVSTQNAENSESNQDNAKEAKDISCSSIFGFIKQIYSNITVEPLIICWLLPFLVTYAAIENMNLEKGCRELVLPEYGFNKDVCKLFVRKNQYGINCHSEFKSGNNEQIKAEYEDLYRSIENKLPEVYQFLCDAEEKVQDKLSQINSIRNPIAAIGPLVIILFAGPWSDKNNLRVPCMIVPFLGEAIGYITLFIAAIFINGPVEFPAYAYRLIPSLTGAENLMVMGIYSYLTAISSEENRTLRFGMFTILMTIVPIIAQLISPFLINRFDYTELFGSMIPIHIIGLLYALYYLKEPTKREKQKEDATYDNPAIELEMGSTNGTLNSVEEERIEETKRRNACVEFFDPQLAIYCIKSFLKKRKYGLRRIIILFMLLHFVVHGITQGETPNLILYVRDKLNWDIDFYLFHSVFSIVMGLIGTSVAIGVLSKMFQVTDIMLIILSTILSIICRVVYIFAKTSVAFFSATAIDFMYSIKFLGVRSIISKIVPSEDLSTMFAIMGLFEALAGFVFPFVYPTLYGYLLKSRDHDVSEIFILSDILLSGALIVYIFLWRLLKNKDKVEQKEDQSEDTKL